MKIEPSFITKTFLLKIIMFLIQKKQLKNKEALKTLCFQGFFVPARRNSTMYYFA